MSVQSMVLSHMAETQKCYTLEHKVDSIEDSTLSVLSPDFSSNDTTLLPYL